MDACFWHASSQRHNLTDTIDLLEVARGQFMAAVQAMVKVTRWQGGQHPTLLNISHSMQREGLRPHVWINRPNSRHAVRSHGYHKVLYVVDGTLDITLPDSNQQIRLRSGDRIDIPAGVRHGTVVGSHGVKCAEASLTRRRIRN